MEAAKAFSAQEIKPVALDYDQSGTNQINRVVAGRGLLAGKS